MSYMRKHYALFLVLGVMFLPATSFASEQDVRAQCFATLKENMSEAKIFSEPLQVLQKMSYGELEPMFSMNYKNLASFGLEIDKGDMEMRVYSFGRQTGYIHPPESPFPSSTKSDKWKEPTKEFIVAEEQITDPKGKKHFLNCTFFSIRSDDLLSVTRENYLYDGEMTSLTKVAKDGNYKAWYSEDVSFDYNNKPFVEWKRLFIYPKLTQNDYFNRYDIAEVFPANKVESFEVLKFFIIEGMTKLQDYDSSGSVIISYVIQNNKGEFTRIDTPKELSTLDTQGQDNFHKRFPLADYYQAIENRFPTFAEKLSFRGTLKYDTFKKLFAIKGDSVDANKLLESLIDYRSIAMYSLDKKNKEKEGIQVSDPEKDKLLQDFKDVDSVAEQLLARAEAPKVLENKSNWLNPLIVAGSAILVLGVAMSLWFFWRKTQINK